MSGIQFGCFGREESALVCILRNGKLNVQILKRHVTLDADSGDSFDAIYSKKSKAYVDCIKRERLKGKEMFHVYQTDLLRTLNWKNYEKLFEINSSLAQECINKSLKVSVQVHSFV